MVSTRGGARTRAEDPKTTMLAQKPKRAPAAKAKTTRSTKKAEPEPEIEEEDELQVQHEEEAPVKKTTRKTVAKKEEVPKQTRAAAKEEAPKATRGAARGVKKDEAVSKPVPAAKATTRTTTTKVTKAKTAEADKPELPPPATKGRATRATRATAAKEKATPLSPKKITQISKAPARTTRIAASKAKPAAPKAATRGRPAIRRNVSDENAEVEEMKAAKEKESEEELKPAVKSPKRKVARKAVVQLDEDDTPASTRPSTPAQESEHEDEHEEEDEDDELAQEEGEASDSEDELQSRNVSGDELCGPKTPMKRCSPREGTKYVSPQKSSHSTEVPAKTPARRYERLGRTPQTQRLAKEPFFVMSESKPAPTTVARAQDRAMVFPKLQRLAESPITERNVVAEDDAEETEESADADIDIDMDIEAVVTPLESADDTMFDAHVSENVLADSLVEDVDEDAAAELPSEPASEGSEDPDETIVVEKEVEDEPEAQDHLFMQSDESVLIVPGESAEGSPANDVSMSTASVEPETMVWENIREDVTIPFNFDSDLTAQALPQVEHNERLSLVPSMHSSESPELDTTPTEITAPQVEAEERLSVGSTRVSLGEDATVNISDFLDVKSLSESTAAGSPLAKFTPAAEPQKDVEDQDVAEEGKDIDMSPMVAPATPTQDAALEEDSVEQSRGRGRSLPRYAQPTIASRSKSVPTSPYRTPRREDSRPKTSDGFSMPRLAYTSRPSWLKTPARFGTPAIKRPNTSHGMVSTVKRGRSRTPAARTPWAKTPGTSVPQSSKIMKATPVSRTLFAATPNTSVPTTATPVAKERFPVLGTRRTYQEFIADDEVDVATPKPAVPASAAKERFPGLPPSASYEALVETPVLTPTEVKRTPAARKSARQERFPGLPSRDTYEELAGTPDTKSPVPSMLATPQPPQEERFPGLPSRRTYEEHAKTAMPVSRFQTPPKLSVAKRPATAHKPTSLRKVALKASHTPMKTPLKGLAMTPGQEPMTPHPAAPLRGVVALAEVYTSDGSCATPAFTVLLQRLGAKTTKTFSERVTHVIFKEGSPQLLQRLRVHNKQVLDTGIGNEIFCVNSRWVNDCDSQGRRVEESDEIYAVDMDEVPRSAKRRRKSMEPMSLMNMGGGNVVRSSLGRSSLGWRKSVSPPMEFGTEDKENSAEEAEGSPATPAYLKDPESLVMMTEAPKRVRKLDLGGEEKRRRQTFFVGEF